MNIKALAVLVSLASCTGVTSQVPTQENFPTGLAYYLPTSLLPLTISVTANGMTMTAAGLEYIPDERHAFVLRNLPSVVTTDDATFEVSNGLLNSVSLESDGKLDEIAAEAAKSLRMFENVTSAPASVFSDKIRVDKLLSGQVEADGMTALARLNKSIRSGISRVDPANAKNFRMTIEREFPQANFVSATPEQCKVGFCYRVPVSYILRASYKGQVRTARFMAPNNSPTYVVSVQRGLFGKWLTKANLTNGMLSKLERDIQSSELGALVSLPGRILSAQLDGFRSRVEIEKAKVELEKQQVEIEKAKLELEKQKSAGRVPESSPLALNYLFQLNFGAGAVSNDQRSGNSPLRDNPQIQNNDNEQDNKKEDKPREISGSDG